MLDLGEGVILAGATPEDSKMYLSRSLLWFVAPASLPLLDDLCFVVRYPESADRWISYRLVTAEWLTWLRIHYLDGKDPRTVAVLQDRQRRLRPTMKEFIPELVGATVELPDSYEPPPLDGVENARQ